MKSGAANYPAPTDLRTNLGEGVEITGEIKFTEALKIDAKVNGQIKSDSGNLIVTENAKVMADIEAGFVEVYGSIEGKVSAKYKVEIKSGGRVQGDIFTPVLNIEHGAFFDGKCHMTDDSRKKTSATP